MKNIIDKTKQYIKLNGKELSGSKLTAEEFKQLQQLRRELAARGLVPQHIIGLEYRATVLAYKTKVSTFVAMREDDKRYAAACNYLKSVGIDPNQQRLSRILGELKRGAKYIDKKKSTRCVCMARQETERNIAAVAAEISADDAKRAAQQLAADEKARQERDRIARESINAFAAEAFGV